MTISATMLCGSGIDATVEAAKAAERQGRWGEARQHYQQALQAVEHTPISRAALLRWIGRTHLDEGHPDKALELFSSALELSETVSDRLGMAHATNCLAITEQQMGNLEHAESLYGHARAHAVEITQDALVAMIDQNLGTIANIHGNLALALECYESSLTRYRSLEMVEYQAHVLNNMGRLHTDLGAWDAAEVAYQEAKQACLTVGDAGQLTRIEINQAGLWIARQNIEQASTRCVALLARAEATGGDAPWIGEVYKHYGVVCRERNDYGQADAYFKRAARIAVETWDLLLAAETAREQVELYWRQQRHSDALRAMHRAHTWFTQLQAYREITAIERRTVRLEEQFLEVARRWGESIESKDHYTQGHCERVAEISCALAKRIGFDEKTLFWFRIGALLHDVGKLIVPSEILNKPGRLTDDEWQLMRRHPEAGVELLSDVEFPWDVRPMVRNHHERWDGHGYPDQLAGESIPLSARILCIADVYDALTTSRSYRAGYSHQNTIDMMSEESGHFDPRLFRVFLEWAKTYAAERAA